MKRLTWNDPLTRKIMNRYKLVTIITKEVKDKNGAILQQAGIATRVPKRMAEIQVERGLAQYTSKGRLKQIRAEQKKRERAEEIKENMRRALKKKMEVKPSNK